MMKIYNYQEVTTGYRSNEIELDSESIQVFRDWNEHAYVGTTDKDLVQYIAGLRVYLREEMMDMSGERGTNTPELAKTVYSQLFGDEVERTELWNSLDKTGESELKLEDEEGNDLATAASIM